MIPMTLRRSSGQATTDYLLIEPRLVEDATFLRLQGHPLVQEFHEERSALYAIDDPGEQEDRFDALHTAWFHRLELDQPLRRALQEYPSLQEATQNCLVCRAEIQRVQGVDLHIASGGVSLTESANRTLVIRLCAETFSDPNRLLGLLRHEFMHVSDMLDADFGYRPELAPTGTEPGRRHLFSERYRVLWNITVNGRLARRGQLLKDAEAVHRDEFEQVFSMLGKRLDSCYRSFYDCDRPIHRSLAEFALNPVEVAARAPVPGLRISDRPAVSAPSGPAPR